MAREQHAADRFGQVDLRIDPGRGIPLYVQVADLMRHRVFSGAWTPGLRLDNLDVLAENLQVARVTVRQAVRMLVEEGLLTTARGRGTFVAQIDGRDGGPAASVLDAMSPETDSLRIEIVYKGRVGRPDPDYLGDWQPFESYTELTKIHFHDEVPFGLIRIFIADELLRLLPRKAPETRKLLRLVMREAGPMAETLHQTMTVEPADSVLANHLNQAFGAPVAKIMRRVVSSDGRLAYAGLSWYRGDRFQMEMTLPKALVLGHPAALIAPRSRAV